MHTGADREKLAQTCKRKTDTDERQTETESEVEYENSDGRQDRRGCMCQMDYEFMRSTPRFYWTLPKIGPNLTNRIKG